MDFSLLKICRGRLFVIFNKRSNFRSLSTSNESFSSFKRIIFAQRVKFLRIREQAAHLRDFVLRFKSLESRSPTSRLWFGKQSEATFSKKKKQDSKLPVATEENRKRDATRDRKNWMHHRHRELLIRGVYSRWRQEQTVRNREFASAGCILPTNWGEGEGGLEGEQWLQQPRGPPYVRISWKSCGRRCRGSLEYLAFNLITQLPHPRREATLSSFVWNGGGHFLPFPRVSPAFSAANRESQTISLASFFFFSFLPPLLW